MPMIIHDVSGAIVGSRARAPSTLPEGFGAVEGNASSYEQWWDSAAFVAREAAALSLSPNPVAVGDTVVISAPAGSFKRLPDGTITDADSFVCPAGYRAITVSLMGRYRGEARIELA